MTTATAIRCEACGGPATLTTRNDALSCDEGCCDACANHSTGYDEGESTCAVRVLAFAVAQLELSLDDDQIREALERILAGRSERHREATYSTAAQMVGSRYKPDWLTDYKPINASEGTA